MDVIRLDQCGYRNTYVYIQGILVFDLDLMLFANHCVESTRLGHRVFFGRLDLKNLHLFVAVCFLGAVFPFTSEKSLKLTV